MKKYISLVCGAVLLAALAVGCSGAFGFDGKDGVLDAGNDGGTGSGGGTGNGKDNPFKGTVWEDSTNGITLSFDEDTCKITKGTVKTASIARAATSGSVNGGSYSYTWKLNDVGSFTATLRYNGYEYATFTIDASGAVSGTLRIGTNTYTFGKKTSTGGGTATETPGTFSISTADGKLVKYTIGDKTDITIPDTVTYIGANAFNGCGKLTSVRIPATVESIGKGAFSGCPNAKVYYDGTQEDWNRILFYTEKLDSTATSTGLDGRTITGKDDKTWKFNDLSVLVWESGVVDKAIKICGYRGDDETVKIPLGATHLYQTFKDNKTLKSVVIPSSVTEIEIYAFYKCTSLTSVTISNGVTSIGVLSFTDCSNLESIVLPDSTTEIHGQAFSGCTSLKSVIIPGRVTNIGNGAFYNCSSLESVTIPNSVTNIGQGVFANCNNLTTVKYDGTKEQWDAIEFTTGGSGLYGKTIVCTDGNLTAEE